MISKNLLSIQVWEDYQGTIRWYQDTSYGKRKLGPGRISLDFWHFGLILENFARRVRFHI
jgi:hypothetical protein